jgi:threonine/homoserine/homoserine lactone efflux protein
MSEAPPSGHVHASRGFIVAITNPKSIAFFTAFLPQFIDQTLPIGHQLLVMCTVSIVIGAVFDSGWGVAAAWGRQWFLKPRHNKLLGRLSSVALIGGGIWLSLARRPG